MSFRSHSRSRSSCQPGAPHRRIALAVSIATTALAGLVGSAGTVEAVLAKEIFHPSVGPLGPVTVIGDSVLLGSIINAPTVGDRLVELGWGPVRERGGGSYSTGAFPVTTEARSSYWIQKWRQEGWDPPNVLVNLGANDSGFCDVDLQCARTAILHLADTIGPGHQVWWPQVTRHSVLQRQADNWNRALREIAAERENFFTWDWPAVMAARGFPSGDNTHLAPSGYRERSKLLAAEFTADLAQGHRTGGPAPLPRPVGEATELVPLEPGRVVDTRVDPPGRVAADSSIVVDVAGLVPPGTTAVAAYVSATDTTSDGFLTAYDCSTGRPEASTANHLAGETRGAVAITPLGADGRFCLFTRSEAHLLVDLQAAFVPVAAEPPAPVDEPPPIEPPPIEPLRFDAIDRPIRLLDTRVTGRSQLTEVTVPDGAAAVAVSITAILSDDHGFVVAYPCADSVPLVATVNHAPDEVISGTAFVPVGPDGTICLWSHRPVDLTVDLTGTFSVDGSLVFQPARPTRMIDTRTGTGGWTPLLGRAQTIDAIAAPPSARAVTGTLTIVAPLRNGFIRAWGCGAAPETANVTALAGGVLANSVTTGVADDGRLCVYANAATTTLFDTSGWWELGS